MHITLPNNCILRCSIRAIHEKYVTLRYQINIWKLLWLTFQKYF